MTRSFSRLSLSSTTVVCGTSHCFISLEDEYNRDDIMTMGGSYGVLSGVLFTETEVDMYILIQFNKVIKDASDCTKYQTVLQKEYTMKHHWGFGVFFEVCNFCATIGL